MRYTIFWVHNTVVAWSSLHDRYSMHPMPVCCGGQRDQAILSTLLYHGLRRAELWALTIGCIRQRHGPSAHPWQGP